MSDINANVVENEVETPVTPTPEVVTYTAKVQRAAEIYRVGEQSLSGTIRRVGVMVLDAINEECRSDKSKVQALLKEADAIIGRAVSRAAYRVVSTLRYAQTVSSLCAVLPRRAAEVEALTEALIHPWTALLIEDDSLALGWYIPHTTDVTLLLAQLLDDQSDTKNKSKKKGSTSAMRREFNDLKVRHGIAVITQAQAKAAIAESEASVEKHTKLEDLADALAALEDTSARPKDRAENAVKEVMASTDLPKDKALEVVEELEAMREAQAKASEAAELARKLKDKLEGKTTPPKPTNPDGAAKALMTGIAKLVSGEKTQARIDTLAGIAAAAIADSGEVLDCTLSELPESLWSRDAMRSVVETMLTVHRGRFRDIMLEFGYEQFDVDSRPIDRKPKNRISRDIDDDDVEPLTDADVDAMIAE
jgi:hypothetical protein